MLSDSEQFLRECDELDKTWFNWQARKTVFKRGPVKRHCTDKDGKRFLDETRQGYSVGIVSFWNTGHRNSRTRGWNTFQIDVMGQRCGIAYNSKDARIIAGYLYRRLILEGIGPQSAEFLFKQHIVPSRIKAVCEDVLGVAVKMGRFSVREF